MKEYIKSHESYSASGDDFKGDGGDYIVEAENRNLKSHLPPGIPSLKNWIISSRCDKYLKNNRCAVFSRAGIPDPGLEKPSLQSVEMEVQMFRKVIRSSGMLSDPLTEKPLVSITGEPLYPDLVNLDIQHWKTMGAIYSPADFKAV